MRQHSKRELSRRDAIRLSLGGGSGTALVGLLDAANPGRLSFRWQYFDLSPGLPLSGRFRPQDLITVHVLDATVGEIEDQNVDLLLDKPF
jgi:hypothetical protein